MTRVLVVVEGESEAAFITAVLAPEFWGRSLSLSPIRIGKPGHKGGRVKYDRLLPDVLTPLKQDRRVYCSTMVDYFRLGTDFPGVPPPANFSSKEAVLQIEAKMKEDVCARVPELEAERRFLPYIQLHEYEGLLFSDPGAFAKAIHQAHLVPQFQKIRESFPTPEDINNAADTAPSKRVLAAYPGYSKVIEGTQAAQAVGVSAMRAECPHFRQWLEQLEALGASS